MQQIMKANILLIIGTFIILLSAIFMACFGLIFTSLLNNMLMVDPEGAVFKNFDSPSVPIYMDFYMFNVTNPEEVQRYGAKPRLQELGPYSYLEKLQKNDYAWNHTDGTVEYRQNTTYFFVEERSNGTLNDKITTLNAVMVIVGALTYENRLVRRFIWPQIESGMDLFDTFTVDELLFEGWDLPIFDFDFSFFPKLEKTANLTGSIYEILLELGMDIPFLEPNKIGLYYGKNGTDDGVYKVKTGELGMEDYLYIQEWNHEPELNFWDSEYCNMINGTDGTQYPPGVKRDKTIRLFTTDLCRSLFLLYERDVDIQSIIPSYHYIPPPEMLESPLTNPDNMCYCRPLPGSDTCLNDSMMNMAPCFKGAPIILSTPHFYQGNEEDVNKCEGLNPQKEYHETYLDIEPTTGVVMEAAKRIQLNLPLKKYGGLPAFMDVPELIFPLFWASENAQIPEDKATSLQRVLTLPYLVVYIVCGLLIFIGLTMVIIGAVKHHKSGKTPKNGVLLNKK